MAAVKGAQSMPKRPNDRVPPGVRGEIVRIPVANDPSSQWQGSSHNHGADRSSHTQTRGGIIEVKFKVKIVKDGGTCAMSA